MKFKKIISMSLAALMLFLSVGCNQAKKKNIETPSDFPTDTQTEQKISGNSNSESCRVVHYFFSVSDFDTYMRTGSTNTEDYDHEPDGGAINLPSKTSSTYELFSKHYIPLDSLFEFTEESLSAISEVSVQFLDNSDISYRYHYNRQHLISVTYSPKETTDHISLSLAEQINSNQDLPICTIMSNKTQYDHCIIERNLNGCDLVYEFQDNILKNVTFILGDYKITIASVLLLPEASLEEVQQAYNTFMTSTATAPLTVFFSEDDSLCSQAITKLQSNISSAMNIIK